ncbi:MAG TPA: hypothetical protein PLY93_01190 [Turneriella sp.]|nr:hypothetical protein [Turneriella sp.]
MRRIIIPLSLLTTLSVFAFGAKVVKVIREPKAIILSLEKGFGVQKDARNELTFTSVKDGKQLKKVTALTGKTAVEDNHYFSRLNAVTLPTTQGKVRVQGRIFYCSFAQKYCSVQKIDEEL